SSFSVLTAIPLSIISPHCAVTGILGSARALARRFRHYRRKHLERNPNIHEGAPLSVTSLHVRGYGVTTNPSAACRCFAPAFSCPAISRWSVGRLRHPVFPSVQESPWRDPESLWANRRGVPPGYRNFCPRRLE